jgi:hypothetical protein
MRQVGIGQSAAEAWYRDRAMNGHPEPVLTVGRRLYFDEETVLGWARSRLDRTEPPPRIIRNGRMLVTGAEIGRLTGLSEQALAGLYARRAKNGLPEATHQERRFLYFDEDAVCEWDRRRRAVIRASLTEVDRSGDPQELVDTAEAARILGYAGPNTITSYLSRNSGYFPDPDDPVARRWRRATVWSFADRRSRPGRGGHDSNRATKQRETL